MAPRRDMQFIEKIAEQSGLSRRAVSVLLTGRYRRLLYDGEGTISDGLARIASAYSRAELLRQPGIGSSTLAEIDSWLHKRGRALRVSHIPVAKKTQKRSRAATRRMKKPELTAHLEELLLRIKEQRDLDLKE
jgi:hypothetical protein